MKRKEMHTRQTKAFATVLVLIALVFVIEVVFQLCESKTVMSFAEEISSQQSIKSELEGMLDEQNISSPVSVPVGFEDEVFTVENRQNLACDAENQVVGFWDERKIDEVSFELETELKERNWTHVPSGDSSIQSWVKNKGDYTWLLIQFVSMEGGVSVVVSYR